MGVNTALHAPPATPRGLIEMLNRISLPVYDMVKEIFERSGGDPDQFLPFDKSLVPEQYRNWDVMTL